MWLSADGGVKQGSRAFLVFVIIPSSICRTSFGGDKKQQERMVRVLGLLLLDSEAP